MKYRMSLIMIFLMLLAGCNAALPTKSYIEKFQSEANRIIDSGDYEKALTFVNEAEVRVQGGGYTNVDRYYVFMNKAFLLHGVGKTRESVNYYVKATDLPNISSKKREASIKQAADMCFFQIKDYDCAKNHMVRFGKIANENMSEGGYELLAKYPLHMFRKEHKGKEVKVKFNIEKDGTTSNIVILHSPLSKKDNQTVVKIVEMNQYKPIIVGGNPKVTEGVVNIMKI